MGTTSQGKLGRPDLVLLATILILLTLGLDMVYSASFVVAHNSPQYGSATYFLTRQLMWIVIGLAAMFVAMNFDYRHLRYISLPFILVVLALLVAVLFTSFGHEEYGAQRWLYIGPLPSIQPSELAKIAIIIYFANWLSRSRERAASFTHGALPFAIMLGLIAGLVLAQHDLGSTAIIVAISLALFFIGGANIMHFVIGAIAAGSALVTAMFAAGYRSDRIEAFLDPTKDPFGIGWHTIQTNIALGSGGIIGLGLGASRQKFYWLPAAHTDAILAVIGEELGFIGATAVVALFMLFAYRGFKIMLAAPDNFGQLLAGGITIWIVVQALVNMAVITSLVPYTGITLPFVSYGGSSMAVSLLSMGILLNISRQVRQHKPTRAAGRFSMAEVDR